jgi:hypothetical protein
MAAATPTAGPRAGGWLWLVPGALGLGATGLFMLVLPPDRAVHGLADFALKVSPLLLAVATIALFSQAGRLARWPLLLGLLFYLGYVDSASFVHVSALAEAAVDGRAAAQFPAFYRWAIFVNAFTVLFALLAYRLGGASTARTLKLGGVGVLMLVSGLNDLTMWAMNDWPDGRPDTFDWASHVAVFLGRTPHLSDMLLFLAVHLALAGLLLAAPIERWLSATPFAEGRRRAGG